MELQPIFASIPPAYLDHMQRLLGEEFASFRASLAEPSLSGLRVNTLKLPAEDFANLTPFQLRSVPWCPSGFILNAGEQSGRHPYHAAGLFYLQEPSAMLVAELLAPRPGERVLDLSAAPGGKSTHLAALMGNQGLLVANEIHPKRVWNLAQNLERCGVRMVAITNESPERLADHFGSFFDRVLVDAPCSGEGMFRKSQPARAAWSPELVQGCALRQAGILESAARLVHPGGQLAYSTCTFSPQENESLLADFLSRHGEFEMAVVRRLPATSPGRPEWAGEAAPESLRQAARIWPHLAPGEGHFVAILQRDDTPGTTLTKMQPRQRIPIQTLRFFEDFQRTNLLSLPLEPRLHLSGSYLYHLPDGLPDLSGLRVIHPGWWLGTLKTNRFEPAHALALGLSASDARRAVELDGRVEAYLKGESLPAEGEDGWVLMVFEGYPLGWGKRSKGVIKNFYPKGLRNQ